MFFLNRRKWAFELFIILLLTWTHVSAKDFQTNAVNVKDAPIWLRPSRVEKIIDKIQSRLEWSTRRVNMFWHSSSGEFKKFNGLGSMAAALTSFKGGVPAIHLGPKVNEKNFDQIFGHELVHVIIFQKYKGAIPKWLEEGLANHLAGLGKVDYKWLAKQPFPADVHDLAHPFSGDEKQILYRYKASQAFAQMLDKKCDLENLIRLSVERKIEDYINTYCGIKDLNKSFQDWITTRT